MPILLQLQKLPWKGDGRCKKKVSLLRFFFFFVFFLAAQKIASSLKKLIKKSVLGHPI